MHYSVPSHVQQKSLVNFDSQLYPKNRIFRNTIFQSLGAAVPEIFTRAIECLSLASLHPLGIGAPPTIF